MQVPTILYFLKQRIPEQIDDTPVPNNGRGASGRLQGFLPGRFSSALVEQTVDIPALRSGVRRLQGFLPEQSATAFGEADHRVPAASEEIADFSVSGGGFQDLRPGQSSASSSHSPADFADDAFQWVFRTFHQYKKERHYLRTRARNCLRTRAYGRRLQDVPRRRRMTPRTSLTLTSSTWGLMGAGGGASESRLASSIAGGWPRQMGHRLAILYGRLRGSSAEGQGDWGLVRQWIHGLRQLLGACAVLCFLSTRRGTRILASSLSCFLVCWSASHAEWILQLPSEPVVARGNWTSRSRAPCIWQFLFAVLVYSSWRNAWFNSGYMLCVCSWCFWKVFFVKVNSFPEVDSRPALLGPRGLEKCAQFLLRVAWAATL